MERKKDLIISPANAVLSSRTLSCCICCSRSRRSIIVLFVILACCLNMVSSHSLSRHRKSADINPQTFECSDANTHLYHVLSQSKTARSLGSDSSISDRHHPTIPKQAISGNHLKVCSQGFTCCTEEMETRLLGESRREFQKSVQDKIVGLSHTFESRTTKFDRFFRELITNARRDLHSMFLRTYGLLYEQNSDIFAALFDNLTHYYGNGPSNQAAGAGANLQSNNVVNLSRSIDSFYNTLYQRMFRILNQPYDFEPRYWQCMSGQMDRLKPFGDVPSSMKLHVQKAFIAARTFVQGLAAGRDVVRRMMELSPSNECTSGLMRMLYCPHCRGLSNVKPCSNFCLNVMKGCLTYQADFDHSWNEYLDALLQLLSRLEGPFNIETVIDPIDVKISEAIMIFQDRGKEISDQIFTECGAPKMGPARRHRRTSQARESDKSEQRSGSNRRQQQGRANANSGGNSRSRQRQQKQQQQHMQFSEFLSSGTSPLPNQAHVASVRPTTAAGTSLDRLSRDLREKVQPAKGFWRHLPHTLCSDDKISSSTTTNLDGANDKSDSDCWNGLSKDKYESPVVSDGPFGQLVNPEMPADSSRSNNSVRELLSKLRTATAAMKKAYNGQEPDWKYATSVNIDPVVPAHKASIASPAKGIARKTTTPRPSRAKQDLIGPPVGDGSGDPFDDTEVFKPKPGSNVPKDTDDEELTEGSGSGDDEIPAPPRVVASTKAPTTKRPALVFGRTTKKPTRPTQVMAGHGEDSTEGIDFGDEDTTTRGLKTTSATLSSSEESPTFEPVTTTPDPDDNDDSEEDYDPELDGDSGWKEDDDGLVSANATATPATTQTVQDITNAQTSTSSVTTTTAQKLVITTATKIVTTQATTRPVVTTVPRQGVPTRKVPPATRKPGSGGSGMRLCSSNFILILAFYLALSLLWKRLYLA